MMVTIHQPEHMPYWGYLDKVNKADLFVILDDVQFKKNNFQNRNRILTAYGPKWLTIPVMLKHNSHKNINEIMINGKDWKEKYWGQIENAYRLYPFYNEHAAWVRELLDLDSEFLIDYNMFIIQYVFDMLGITTPIVLSSGLDVETSSSQRLLDICVKVEADAYLAGQGAIDYLDERIFEDNIKLIKHQFTHPVYEQHAAEEFVSHMSCIDMLMSAGVEQCRKWLHG